MSSNFPLDKMCVPGSNIYIIGYKATQVSLYAQQVRALDLVYELAKASNDSDEPLSNKRIAVIGAGAAGLTAAAAAGLLGAQVILLEEQAEFMHLQRGCYTRYLHPQIYDWPENTAFAPSSSLPILAWSTGTADAVAEQIVDQFYAINRRLEQKQRSIQCKFGVRNIKINDRMVSWSPSPQKEEKLKEEKNLDAIILALGFGIEKTVEQLPRRSYWRLDSLDQSHLDSTDIPYKVLVAGTGDGGIIDVLRAALIGFDHGPFLDRCLLIMRDEDFLKEVKELEEDIQSEYEKSIDEAAKIENATKDTKIIEEKAERAASKKLNDGYKEIGQNEKFKKIFKELDQLLKQSLRPQSKIVWVGRLAFPPHSTKSMPFNRMLVWRLLEMDNSPIKYVRGSVARVKLLEQEPTSGFRYAVNILLSEDTALKEQCHQAIVRIGSKSALERLLNTSRIKLPGAPKACLEHAVFKTFWEKRLKQPTSQTPKLYAFSDPKHPILDPNNNWPVHRILVYVKDLPPDIHWVEYDLNTEWGLVRRRARQVQLNTPQSMMLFTTSELDRQTELETTQLQNSFLSWFYITPIWIIEDMPTTVHPILDSPEQSNSQEEIQKANPSDNRYKNYMLRVRLSNGYEWEENVIKAMAHHDEEIAKAMERHKKEYPAPKLC